MKAPSTRWDFVWKYLRHSEILEGAIQCAAELGHVARHRGATRDVGIDDSRGHVAFLLGKNGLLLKH